MLPEKLNDANKNPGDLHQFFNLIKIETINSNMNLFDENGRMKKYKNAEEILKEFYNLRLKIYEKRKKNDEGKYRVSRQLVLTFDFNS